MNKLVITILVVVVLGVIVFLLSGNSSTTSSYPVASQTDQATVQASQQASSTKGESYSVEISGFAFNSASLSIKVGDSVTWTNKDSASHTVTSDSGSELNSDSLATGGIYSHTFNTPGTYAYHCAFHPGMKGTITVT